MVDNVDGNSFSESANVETPQTSVDGSAENANIRVLLERQFAADAFKDNAQANPIENTPTFDNNNSENAVPTSQVQNSQVPPKKRQQKNPEMPVSKRTKATVPPAKNYQQLPAMNMSTLNPLLPQVATVPSNGHQNSNPAFFRNKQPFNQNVANHAVLQAPNGSRNGHMRGTGTFANNHHFNMNTSNPMPTQGNAALYEHYQQFLNYISTQGFSLVPAIPSQSNQNNNAAPANNYQPFNMNTANNGFPHVFAIPSQANQKNKVVPGNNQQRLNTTTVNQAMPQMPTTQGYMNRRAAPAKNPQQPYTNMANSPMLQMPPSNQKTNPAPAKGSQPSGSRSSP